MTTTDRPGPIRRRRPSPPVTFAVSAALFLLILGFLSYQLARGQDPALGSNLATAEGPDRPAVTVRRIIERRIITTVVPVSGAASSREANRIESSRTSSAPVTTTAPAPAVSASS